jgi:hypothetical protein
MNNYLYVGSVHLQGAPGRPLITLLPETIEAMRSLQAIYPDINMTVLVNEAIMEGLNERDEQIRSLHVAAEELSNERVHNNSRGSIQ